MSSKLAIGLTDAVKAQQENLMTDNEKKTINDTKQRSLAQLLSKP